MALDAQRQAQLRRETERLQRMTRPQQVAPAPQTPTVTERFAQIRQTVSEASDFEQIRQALSDAAESTGRVVSRFAEEFSTTGGVQNRDDFHAGRITEAEYTLQQVRESAEDAAITGIGATLGGGLGGTAGALSSGGTMALPATQAGAVLGAATTYTAVRATRAIGRTAHAMSSSGSSSGGRGDDTQPERRQQTSEVRNDAGTSGQPREERSMFTGRRISSTGPGRTEPMKGMPAPSKIHKNSNTYKGETHLYHITESGVEFKIGESAQGLNKFGKSKRAEQQAQRLRKETGKVFDTEIIANFLGKKEARAAETKLILERRAKNPNALPGNKGVH